MQIQFNLDCYFLLIKLNTKPLQNADSKITTEVITSWTYIINKYTPTFIGQTSEPTFTRLLEFFILLNDISQHDFDTYIFQKKLYFLSAAYMLKTTRKQGFEVATGVKWSFSEYTQVVFRAQH